MGKVAMYGLVWPDTTHPAQREIDCIRHGGKWLNSKGAEVGQGIQFHMRRFQEIIWPEKVWTKWAVLELELYLKHRMIGVIGCASSGKSFDAATNVLADYYSFPSETTVLLCSTEREMLEMRILGELKKAHRAAKERVNWLPGHLIESRQRIVTDSKFESIDGRDFRNGLLGIPCKKGGSFQGMGAMIGIKNKRVRLVVDEAHLLPRIFIDSISNLNKNHDFKCIVLGNPKETTDALGVFCEPSAKIGGWDGGIDQTPGTKTWETRFTNGICLQLPGSDSPNMDAPEDQPPPYPFLITRDAIAADIKFYGRDSLQFSMFNEGRMPRGQGSRRVISRSLCLKFNAMDQPIWKDEKRVRIGFLDAAYRGVGGDRCVFGELQFGEDVAGKELIAIIDHLLVPLNGDGLESAEDQIAAFVKSQCETRKIAAENMGFDSTGRGTLMSAFARLWSPYVVPVEFGGTASDRRVSGDIEKPCREYYSKFVSELWFSVRLAIESGQMRGMTNDMVEEGSMREWKLVSRNRVEVETKSDMKLKSGRSPDVFDALVTGVEMARRRGFVIRKLANPSTVRANDEIYKILQKRIDAIRSGHTLNFQT